MKGSSSIFISSPYRFDFKIATMALSGLPTRLILYFLLTLLVADSIIELALIVTTVRYDHKDHPMNVQGPDGRTVILKGKPLGLWTDQGHSSNGAAGTNLVLVGIIGFLLLTLRRKLARWVRAQDHGQQAIFLLTKHHAVPEAILPPANDMGGLLRPCTISHNRIARLYLQCYEEHIWTND